MYSTWIDQNKNRIYIVLGKMGTGEGEKIYTEIRSLSKQLKPGFTAVSDISGFLVADPAEGVWADKILKHLAGAGLAKAVRVTGEVTDKRERAEKYGYRVMLTKTVKEADELLDSNGD